MESDIELLDSGDRTENAKLREEIEKMKHELAHRALKGDFNINARILHYTMNPAAIAEQQAQEKQNAMIKELEDLRAIVTSGCAPTGAPAVSSLQSQGFWSNLN